MRYIYTNSQLEALKRYLEAKNWRLVTGAGASLLIYEGPLDDMHHPIRLALPASAEFVDTSSYISKALNLLSAIEDRPARDLEEAIMHPGSDFLRMCMTPSVPTSTVPLSIIKYVADLMFDSASLEEDAHPSFKGRKNRGEEMLEKCRFGQPCAESFDWSLEVPISPASLDDATQIPFERRVMLRIARGLLSIRRAVQGENVAHLTNDQRQGFNPKLHETMRGLLRSAENAQLEFSFVWGSEYALPQELNGMPALRFVPDLVLPFLESATQSLHMWRDPTRQVPDIQINVIGLPRQKESRVAK